MEGIGSNYLSSFVLDSAATQTDLVSRLNSFIKTMANRNLNDEDRTQAAREGLKIALDLESVQDVVNLSTFLEKCPSWHAEGDRELLDKATSFLKGDLMELTVDEQFNKCLKQIDPNSEAIERDRIQQILNLIDMDEEISELRLFDFYDLVDYVLASSEADTSQKCTVAYRVCTFITLALSGARRSPNEYEGLINDFESYLRKYEKILLELDPDFSDMRKS